MKESKQRNSMNMKSNNSTIGESDVYNENVKKWFEKVALNPKDSQPVSEQGIFQLKDEAKKCLDAEVNNCKGGKIAKNSQWIKTVILKGTISDKIAAYTVTVQDNPVCNLKLLQRLINMIRVGKKRECIEAIDILTELFLSDLLRHDVPLKMFHQQPLSVLNELSSGSAVMRRKLLCYWYFEDQLKELYANFVVALNNIAHNAIDNNKERAITAMCKLLIGNPEQEKNLLTHLVNKLGDPSQKVASKAVYSLEQLLQKHPTMQNVVLNEVEKLLFRSNISSKAQYYGLCFLSQFYLSHDTSEVAGRLVEVYFSFFKSCIKKGEVDSRLMSALLMGVNRAYPYAKLKIEEISGHIDTVYRIVNVANFSNSLHALTLLYQVSDRENGLSDRFYSALYKKLLDPKLLSTTHQATVLSLIYKAVLKDSEFSRVKVFIKRLLQICLFLQPSFACGVLYLISQLMRKKIDIRSLILKQSSLSYTEDEIDDEEEYHDIKNDFVQRNSEDNTNKFPSGNEDMKPDINVIDHSISQPSWYHHSIISKKQRFLQYNLLSRNPLYAGGELCAYTELVYLKNHVHPTVSLFAENLLEGNFIKYSGDPLKDFTLIRFLDRFVFKNPRKSAEIVNQGKSPPFGKKNIYQPKGIRSLPVNSHNYLNENMKNIPVDELFIYNYLRNKYTEKLLREEVSGEDSEMESVLSDDFEDILNVMSETYKQDEYLDYLNDIEANRKKIKDRKKKTLKESEDLRDYGNMSEEMAPDDDESSDLLNDLGNNDDEKIIFNRIQSPENGLHKQQKCISISSLFASAEEFAYLLDEAGSSKLAPGSSNVFCNKDNAGIKQILWEDKRKRWIRVLDRPMEPKQFKAKNRRKRSGSSLYGNKAKKIKNKYVT